MSITDLVSTVETNVGGPALVTRTFIPLLERSTRKVIVNISSTLGSIGMDLGGQHTMYSISKIALNMLVSIRITQSL
jgi:NAD(P)-dependent dehydrogenase (short-subunit alcohol dehydrogenase family)